MLKPLADRVVLKMTKAEETTKSGIILSEGSKENKSRGNYKKWNNTFRRK